MAFSLTSYSKVEKHQKQKQGPSQILILGQLTLTLKDFLTQSRGLGVICAEVRGVCWAQGLALLGTGARVSAAIHLELIDIRHRTLVAVFI